MPTSCSACFGRELSIQQWNFYSMPSSYTCFGRHYSPLAPCNPFRLTCVEKSVLIQPAQDKLLNLLFDVLLDISRIQRASVLRCTNNLRHKLRMGDGLAAFHDPHDGCLRLIISICHHPFMRLFVLLLGFLGLDLIDLNAVFGVGEIKIHGK